MIIHGLHHLPPQAIVPEVRKRMLKYRMQLPLLSLKSLARAIDQDRPRRKAVVLGACFLVGDGVRVIRIRRSTGQGAAAKA